MKNSDYVQKIKELENKIIQLEANLYNPAKFKTGDEVCWVTQYGSEPITFGTILKFNMNKAFDGYAYEIDVGYKDSPDLIGEERLMSAQAVRFACENE